MVAKPLCVGESECFCLSVFRSSTPLPYFRLSRMFSASFVASVLNSASSKRPLLILTALLSRYIGCIIFELPLLCCSLDMIVTTLELLT